MDTNGLPIEGFPSTNLPLGLGAAVPLPADMNLLPLPTAELTAEEMAVADTGIPGTDILTEAEKEHKLFAYKDAQLK